MSEKEKKKYLADKAKRKEEREKKRREKYGDKYDDMMLKHEKWVTSCFERFLSQSESSNNVFFNLIRFFFKEPKLLKQW